MLKGELGVQCLDLLRLTKHKFTMIKERGGTYTSLFVYVDQSASRSEVDEGMISVSRRKNEIEGRKP